MHELRPPPTLCPNCRAEHDGLEAECLRCGVIFAKFKPLSRRRSSSEAPGAGVSTRAVPSLSGLWLTLKDAALTVEERVNPFVLGGRALVFAGLVLWGWRLMTASIASNYVGESFMHLINLPFHEAGHIFFAPLGRFMRVLGGSLAQLLVPALCLGTFLFRQRNPFGASVALWWLAESLMDLAPYINDARALDLILIGGVTGKDVEDYHDWEYILRTLGWLEHDHTLAVLAHGTGTFLMMGSFVWGGYLLLRQRKRVK